ncbi:MAG: energy transducer TonB [Bacteroidota bacterium]
MKISSLFFIFLVNYGVKAQKTEAFYDYSWQPCSSENASYFSTIEKTDSGWLRNDYYITTKRLQMRALYEDADCKVRNGNCVYYHANGFPSIAGRYIHGKQEGICTSYHSNGMISDSAQFHNGQVVDKRFRWHRNGYISDSISRADDSLYVEVGWFDDGRVAYAGHLVNDKQEGKWKYYHHNGQVSSVEMYSRGDLVSAGYFDESGNSQADTSAVNHEATVKGGEQAWKKYLEKKLYWPAGLKFTTPASVTIGVDFVIDENGNVVDAEVSMPFHEQFDKIALSIIKSSPAWIPAMAHNRKIKAYRRQPVTFVQPED